MEKLHPMIGLLDDDLSILKAMSRLLRSLGYAVAAFQEPVEFLNHAANGRLSVAVVDVRMPDMNGLDVQVRLREISPATEVIFLTSQDDLSFRKRALSQGAIGYLHKPVDDAQLLSALKSAVHEQGLDRAKAT